MNSLMQIGIVLSLVDRFTSPLGKSLGAAVKGFDQLSSKLRDTARGLSDVGTASLAIGQALAGSMIKPVAAFADLQESQIKLKTTLMDQAGKVGPEYEKLNALAEKLGTALPGSTRDMIEMFSALREQGVQTNVILGGAGTAAAKFATLMKLPFSEAATHVAKFSESMGVADKDMEGFMDTLQRLKYVSGVEVGDLAYTFKYAGGSLKLLGLQGLDAAKDFSAVIGVLAAAGIEGSTAGTNMAQALSRMAEIGHRLDKGQVKKLVAPVLDKYGIELEFFNAQGEFKGLRDMVKELEKMQALNPQEQIVVLKKLFGDEAARPLAVLLKSGVAGFDEMTRRMQAQAAMQVKIDQIMGGVKMKWDTLTGTVANFVARIGAVISESGRLSVVLDKLNAAFDWVNGFIDRYPRLVGGLGAAAIAVALITAAFGGLAIAASLALRTAAIAVDGFGIISRGATSAAGAVASLANRLKAKWILSRLPDSMFGDVIPGAAKAESGLSLLIARIKAAIATSRLWIVTQYQTLTASIAAQGGLLAMSRTFAGAVVSGIRAAMVAVRGFSVALLTSPVGWIGLAVAGVALLIYKFWKPISGFFKGLWAGLKEGLKGLEPAWDVFKKVAPILMPILVPLKWIWNAVKALLKPVDDVGGRAQNMGVRFGKALAGILTFVLTLPTKMLTAGFNIVNSLFEGMKKAINKPLELMKNLAQKMRNMLPFSPAKEGPLKDIHRIRLIETIAETMKPAPMVQAMKAAATATVLATTLAGPVQAGAIQKGQGPGVKGQGAGFAVQPAGLKGATITFAPVINLAPGTPAEVRQQVDQALKFSQVEFERMLSRAEQNKQRKGFV